MRKAHAAVMFALATAPSPALAWGEDGHWIVCELAYRHLSDGVRAEVDRLVAAHPDARDFASGCHWADRPRKRAGEHYVNYDRGTGTVGALTRPLNDPNVVSAVAWDAGRLADPTLPLEDRADALLYLGHWIGDVHQPLHVSHQDDRGGNAVEKRGACREDNLHAVWDTCLVQRGVMQLDAGSARLGGTRARARLRTADRLGKAVQARLAMPAEERAAAPWMWAAESYAVVTHSSVRYCVRSEGSAFCAYASDNEALEPGEDRRMVDVDDAYVAEMTPVVEESLVFAAARLAVTIEKAMGGR